MVLVRRRRLLLTLSSALLLYGAMLLLRQRPLPHSHVHYRYSAEAGPRDITQELAGPGDVAPAAAEHHDLAPAEAGPGDVTPAGYNTEEEIMMREYHDHILWLEQKAYLTEGPRLAAARASYQSSDNIIISEQRRARAAGLANQQPARLSVLTNQRPLRAGGLSNQRRAGNNSFIIHHRVQESVRRHANTPPPSVVTSSQPLTPAPVNMAPRSSEGQPWPLPQHYTTGTGVTEVDFPRLRFRFHPHCDVILRGVDRARERVKADHRLAVRPQGGQSRLLFMDIHITSGVCAHRPTAHSDESYTLNIRTGSSRLTCRESWGCVRGLDTFSQLMYRRHDDGPVVVNVTDIADYPRFPHRGLLVDTARHFLPVSLLQSCIGAFSTTKVYRNSDVKALVEYAADRGVRIIPEFDSPGHMASWSGQTHLLAPYNGKPSNVINPSLPSTYATMQKLFAEVAKLFPDATVHLGGDEVDYRPWRTMDMQRYMIRKGLRGFSELLRFYMKTLTHGLKMYKTYADFIAWQEVFDEEAMPGPDTVVQVWKGPPGPVMSRAAAAGHRVLLSSCWYLNYIHYGTDWHTHYMCDPLDFPGATKLKKFVIGGEAALWGEYIDRTNFMATLWPRALAVSERLWSARRAVDVVSAGTRMQEQRCRLLRRGVPASPVNGPDHCS